MGFFNKLRALQPLGRKMTGLTQKFGSKISMGANFVGNALKSTGNDSLMKLGHGINKHIANTANDLSHAAKQLDQNNIRGALNTVHARDHFFNAVDKIDKYL